MNDEAALPGRPDESLNADCHEDTSRRTRRTVDELLENPSSLLSRTHLRELGLERRAIDAVFRALPTVQLPGYSRPLIKVADYLGLIEQSTFRDDRVLAR